MALIFHSMRLQEQCADTYQMSFYAVKTDNPEFASILRDIIEQFQRAMLDSELQRYFFYLH